MRMMKLMSLNHVWQYHPQIKILQTTAVWATKIFVVNCGLDLFGIKFLKSMSPSPSPFWGGKNINDNCLYQICSFQIGWFQLLKETKGSNQSHFPWHVKACFGCLTKMGVGGPGSLGETGRAKAILYKV